VGMGGGVRATLPCRLTAPPSPAPAVTCSSWVGLDFEHNDGLLMGANLRLQRCMSWADLIEAHKLT
jgi:hypothetical protein